jgi:hypothetical protein
MAEWLRSGLQSRLHRFDSGWRLYVSAECPVVDGATVKAMLEQHFEFASSDPAKAHEMYHPEAVLEFPQSGERFDGVASFIEWRSEYPAPTTPEIERVRGGGDVWVAELRIGYDGGAPQYAVDVIEFREEKITRETIYVAEGWDAPEWRAKWRSAT